MSKFIDLPCTSKSELDRVLLITDSVRLLVDKEEKVFASDDGETWYEIEMRYEAVKRLIESKDSIAVGRRRLFKKKSFKLQAVNNESTK